MAIAAVNDVRHIARRPAIRPADSSVRRKSTANKLGPAYDGAPFPSELKSGPDYLATLLSAGVSDAALLRPA